MNKIKKKKGKQKGEEEEVKEHTVGQHASTLPPYNRTSNTNNTQITTEIHTIREHLYLNRNTPSSLVNQTSR